MSESMAAVPLVFLVLVYAFFAPICRTIETTLEEENSIPELLKIYIDYDHGYNNASCLTRGIPEVPCKTLDFAFNHSTNSTAYILQSKTHNLTKEKSFTNLANLTFLGSQAEVHCQSRGVGLAFVNVSYIRFDGITFRYCAATRNSTSKKFQASADPKPFSTFDVSLYFLLCNNVTMHGVTVSDSPNATGVVMYSTGGTNVIEHSTFSNNTVTGQQAGGGGFYVEFPYCWPGSQDCMDNETSEYPSVSSSSYEFNNATFSNNVANNEGLNSGTTFIIGYKSNHQSFGRGGGLCIYVKGEAHSNTLTFTDCTFRNNSAQWGAGVMLEFQDETDGNTVSFNNCIFVENTCKFKLESGTGGGGMRLGHYEYSFDKNRKSFYPNKIEFDGCTFTNNSAMYGGGLSISPALGGVYFDNPALINVSHVTFESNIAKFGSALYISRYPFSTSGVMPYINLEYTDFVNNSGHYAKLLDPPESRLPHTVGIGALYINQVNVAFRGSLSFCDNSETGLAVAGSVLDFQDSKISFENNKGYRGGAMALLGSTYLLINDNTTMIFYSNVAKASGGAMFIRYVEMDNLKTQFNCFIRHTNALLQPDKWQANFTYINNTDQNGQHSNSIHSTSIHPCAWAGGSVYSYDISKTLCWNNWKYYIDFGFEVNCSSEITTGPGSVDLLVDVQDGLKVFPGLEFELPMNVTDDLGNDLTNVTIFRSTSNETANETSDYFWGGYGTLKGSENSEVKVVLKTLDDVIWRVELLVKLQHCPPGLLPFGTAENVECSCPNKKMYRGVLTCDSHSHVVTMNDQNWIGYLGNEYVVGLCPPGFCKRTSNSRIILPKDASELAETVCEENRVDVMCGECVEGYGPAINSHDFKCVPCANISVAANVAKYVASVYLPLTFLFVVLILFDIRLTTGPANAFILYSQLVTTTFTLNAYGQIPFNRITHNSYTYLDKVLQVLYGIFNLTFVENVLPPFCLSSSFNALNVLTLNYGVACFPLLMIILTTLCLKLKEYCSSRCFRMSNAIKSVCCCKTRNITQALLPAFASFLLLSYHKFSLAASFLLSSQSLFQSNGSDYPTEKVYFAGTINSADVNYRYRFYFPSLFISIFLGIIAVLLLGYPLTFLEWCLLKIKFMRKIYPADKVHFFFDTFHGCYKVKLRFFAGLYFLFRLTINFTYVLSSTWITQFVVQQLACIIMGTLVALFQPYNKKYLNYVDTLIFANLATLNTLGLYLYSMSRNEQDPPISAFILQYALSLLPLFYMIGFVIYYFFTRESWVKKYLVGTLRRKNYTMHHFVNISDSIADGDTVSRDFLTQSADEQLFERAKDCNQYSKVPDRSVRADSKKSSTGTTSSSQVQSSEGTGYGTMSTGTSDNTFST